MLSAFCTHFLIKSIRKSTRVARAHVSHTSCTSCRSLRGIKTHSLTFRKCINLCTEQYTQTLRLRPLAHTLTPRLHNTHATVSIRNGLVIGQRRTGDPRIDHVSHPKRCSHTFIPRNTSRTPCHGNGTQSNIHTSNDLRLTSPHTHIHFIHLWHTTLDCYFEN